MFKQSNQYPRVCKLLYEVRLIVLTSIPTPIHCGQPHPHHACVRCSHFVLNVRLPMPRLLHNYIPVLRHVDSTAAIATDCLITEHGTVCSINSLGLRVEWNRATNQQRTTSTARTSTDDRWVQNGRSVAALALHDK